MSKAFETELKIRAATNDSFAMSNYANGVDCGQWAYREGIKAAISMLRKEEATEIYVFHSGDFTNNNWAEWLEQQFREELKK